jgi:hypothetical protein
MKPEFFLGFVLVTLSLSACHSPAPATEEVHRDLTTAPRRAIEGNLLVFTAIGEDRFSERAKFLAEGAAFEDIANECSLIPNGAKLESVQERPDTTDSRIFYARAVVDLTACKEAKSAWKPEVVRQLADASLTEQMKKYQDIVGEVNDPGLPAQLTLLKKPIRDEAALMTLRQQIVYQKQKMVASPDATISGHLPAFMTTVANFEKANSKLAQSRISWSYVQRRTLQPVAEPVLSEGSKGKTKTGKSRPALPPKKFPKTPPKPLID